MRITPKILTEFPPHGHAHGRNEPRARGPRESTSPDRTARCHRRPHLSGLLLGGHRLIHGAFLFLEGLLLALPVAPSLLALLLPVQKGLVQPRSATRSPASLDPIQLGGLTART